MTNETMPSEKTARHPSTVQILRHFEDSHLPGLVGISIRDELRSLAHKMTDGLPDGPELTTGLRKLMEARECFLRAAADKARGE